MLYANILAYCYEVIVLTETWLTLEIFDEKLIDDRYTVHRLDHDCDATGKKEGGGTLMAVLKTLRSFRTNLFTTLHANIEHVVIQVPSVTMDKLHIISAVYVPQKTPELVYTAYFEMLDAIFENTNVERFYLIGDFNLPSLEWESDISNRSTFDHCRGDSPVGKIIHDFCLPIMLHNTTPLETCGIKYWISSSVTVTARCTRLLIYCYLQINIILRFML